VIPKAQEVKNALATAQGIAWDTCHKIYILMDEAEVDKMRGYGYDPLITLDTHTPEQMFTMVSKWYRDSCGLRFIDICETPPTDDPNSGFYQVVPQGYEELELEEVI
jgi:hypothetical protein